MKVYRKRSYVTAAAALVFALSGYFASVAATAIPETLRNRPFLAALLFVTCVLIGFALLVRGQMPSLEESPLEAKYDDALYHYRRAFARSIRLVGARDESFPPSRLRVESTDEEYRLPDEFLLTRQQVIDRLNEEAHRVGQMFFDGPNTRLVDYVATPRDATEDKYLTLRLGPVGWYDYSVTKWQLDRMLHPLDLAQLSTFIDLDEVARSGVIRNSRLSNICCTATTVITSDGYLIYSARSDRVSSQGGKLTSCVAENIHQTMDRSLAPVTASEAPVPYRTVTRGFDEEISPAIGEFIRLQPSHLMLLGMDFDLDGCHPDLLFLLFWPKTLAELRDRAKRSPGKDFVEGSMQAVRFKPDEIEHLLLEDGWVPGGKASFMRAVEFINAKRRQFPALSLSGVLKRIAAQNF